MSINYVFYLDIFGDPVIKENTDTWQNYFCKIVSFSSYVNKLVNEIYMWKDIYSKYNTA